MAFRQGAEFSIFQVFSLSPCLFILHCFDSISNYLKKTKYLILNWKRTESRPRNRKLSAKSKKKRGTVVDFFSPFGDASKPFSAYSAAGMAASSYLTNPMSQYYAAGAAMHEQGRVHQSKHCFL